MSSRDFAGRSAKDVYRSNRKVETLQRRRKLPKMAVFVGTSFLAVYFASFVLLRKWHVNHPFKTAIIPAGLFVAFVAWQMIRAKSQHESWNRGAWGERRTGFRLCNLKNSYVAHDLSIPGSSANVDHIVVSRGGVFVIDTKQRNGVVRLDKNQAVAMYGEKEYPIDFGASVWEASRVAQMLGVPAQLVICVTGARMPRSHRNIDGIEVVSEKVLKHWLKRRSRQNVFSSEEFERISGMVDRLSHR